VRTWTRILGIDPGFRTTGYGIVDSNGQESRHVASGAIRATKADTPNGRLGIIFAEVAVLMEIHAPQELAVERVFVHRNADSALKLGQARAAAICACLTFDIPVFEYAAREVKQAIAGKGSAGKDQVEHMVKILLSYSDALQSDESDALGIALCHAHTRTVTRQYTEAMQ